MMRIFFLSLMIVVPLIAQAGGMDAGGGKGVVCRDARGKVKSVELLDLWEARVLYDRNINVSTASIEAQVMQGLQRLKYSIDFSYAQVDGKVYKPEEFLLFLMTPKAAEFFKAESRVRRLRNIQLNLTDDSYESAKPKGCGIEQIVVYVDSWSSPQILVNQDLFEKMNATNQAALIVHEAFYSILREVNQEPNSIRVRRAVGFIFEGQQFPSLRSVVSKKHTLCTNGSAKPDEKYSAIYIYEERDGRSQLIPTSLFSQTSIGFFVPQLERPVGFNLEVAKKYCQNHPNSNMNATYPGAGPVDFTNTFSLQFRCDDQNLSIYLSQRMANQERSVQSVELTCRAASFDDEPARILGAQ